MAVTGRASRLRLPLPRTIPGRRRLVALVVILASAAGGYLTSCALYPRPLLHQNQPVARVIGMPIADAEAELTRQGFKVRVVGDEPDPEIPEGRVRWQDPPPALLAENGRTIEMVRSSGPAPVAVPDVINFDLEYAMRVVAAAGLRLGDVDSVPSSTEAGVVVATRPAAGTGRPPGTGIDLVVSRGPATIRLPNVIGLPLPEARQHLEALGLGVGRITRVSRRGPPDTVLEQRPAPGVMSVPGGRVDLVVSEVN